MLCTYQCFIKSRTLLTYWWLFILTIALTGCQSSRQPYQQPDVLFIAYDQGESNAFLQLEKSLQQHHINYRILAFGRASEVFDEHPLRLDSSVKRQQQLKNDRNNKLSSAEIDSIIHSLHPGIIYSGMSSVVQAQLMNAFKDQGSYTVAFYDNIDPIGSKEYVQPFLSSVKSPDEYHISSQATRDSFDDRPVFAQSKLTVSGNPALEAWDKIYQQTDTDNIRQELNINKSQPVVVFAGGYDTTYQTYLRIFVEATRSMPSILFLVTYHPKTDGSLEKSITSELATGNVRVIEKGTHSTTALSKLSQAVVVHKSSIAAQALYKNKPVLYVAEPAFNNFLTRLELAPVASTPEQVKIELLSIIDTKTKSTGLDRIGAPEKPSETIAGTLLQRLKDLQ